MKNIKRKQAFSLVELMISLIVISLITAAFTPVITKRLSRGLTAVGAQGEKGDKGDKGDSGSGGNADVCGGKTCNDGYYIDEQDCQCKGCPTNCTKCRDDKTCINCKDGYDWAPQLKKCVKDNCSDTNGKPSEACCHSLNAKFIPSSKTGLGYDLCMMEYNFGDEQYTSYDNFNYSKQAVALYPAGLNCDANNFCCWKGQTSSSGNTTFSTKYDGTSRTVCTYEAVEKLCNNAIIGNSVQGSWRQPTNSELSAIATIINAEAAGAGVFSRYLTNILENDEEIDYSKFGLQLCDSTTSDKGSNKCATGTVCKGMINNNCNPYQIWGNKNYYPYSLANGVFKETRNSRTDSSGHTVDAKKAAGIRCVTKNIYARTQDISPEDTSYTTNEPRNQEDCDQYNALFINKKYTKTDKNLCMLYKNFGDTESTSDETHFAVQDENGQGITRVATGTSCSGQYCCWQGTTATGTGNMPYGASNRTVCLHGAAKLLCEEFSPNINVNGKTVADTISAKKWRLPTNAELQQLAYYITAETRYSYFISKYVTVENGGLQLCDESSVDYGANKCASALKCDGATDKRCIPSKIWGDKNYYPYQLDNGIFKEVRNSRTNSSGHTVDASYPVSVRCVTNTVRQVTK